MKSTFKGLGRIHFLVAKKEELEEWEEAFAIKRCQGIIPGIIDSRPRCGLSGQWTKRRIW